MINDLLTENKSYKAIEFLESVLSKKKNKGSIEHAIC